MLLPYSASLQDTSDLPYVKNKCATTIGFAKRIIKTDYNSSTELL